MGLVPRDFPDPQWLLDLQVGSNPVDMGEPDPAIGSAVEGVTNFCDLV